MSTDLPYILIISTLSGPAMAEFLNRSACVEAGEVAISVGATAARCISKSMRPTLEYRIGSWAGGYGWGRYKRPVLDYFVYSYVRVAPHPPSEVRVIPDDDVALLPLETIAGYAR